MNKDKRGEIIRSDDLNAPRRALRLAERREIVNALRDDRELIGRLFATDNGDGSRNILLEDAYSGSTNLLWQSGDKVKIFFESIEVLVGEARADVEESIKAQEGMMTYANKYG